MGTQAERPALVDLAGLRRRLGDSSEAVDAVLASFLRQTPGLMADLKAALARGDCEETRRLAHTVKGSLLWVGAEAAATAAANLELCASGAEGEDAGAAGSRLTAHVEEILRELESTGHRPA